MQVPLRKRLATCHPILCTVIFVNLQVTCEASGSWSKCILARTTVRESEEDSEKDWKHSGMEKKTARRLTEGTGKPPSAPHPSWIYPPQNQSANGHNIPLKCHSANGTRCSTGEIVLCKNRQCRYDRVVTPARSWLMPPMLVQIHFDLFGFDACMPLILA